MFERQLRYFLRLLAKIALAVVIVGAAIILGVMFKFKFPFWTGFNLRDILSGVFHYYSLAV